MGRNMKMCSLTRLNPKLWCGARVVGMWDKGEILDPTDTFHRVTPSPPPLTNSPYEFWFLDYYWCVQIHIEEHTPCIFSKKSLLLGGLKAWYNRAILLWSRCVCVWQTLPSFSDSSSRQKWLLEKLRVRQGPIWVLVFCLVCIYFTLFNVWRLDVLSWWGLLKSCK